MLHATFTLVVVAAAPPDLPRPAFTLPVSYHSTAKMALSSDGRLLAVLSKRYRPSAPTTLDVWDTTTARRILHAPLWTEQHSTFFQHLLDFTPKGKAVVAGAWINDNSTEKYRIDVKVVEVPSGKVQKEMALPSGRGMQGVVTPDGKTLVVSSVYEVAALHALDTGKEVTTLTAPERNPGLWPAKPEPPTEQEVNERRKGEANRLAVSRDGKWLAVGTHNGWVSVWDLTRHRRLWRKQGSDLEVSGLAFSPDSDTLASFSRTSSLIVWRRSDGGRHFERRLPCFPPLFYFADGKTFLLGTLRPYQGFIRWDPVEDRYWGKEERWKQKKYVRMVELTMSQDGKWLALLRQNGVVEIWNIGKLWPK
jgi:WD40 repeat protein